MPAELGWWADTVGAHFSDWAPARTVATELGFLGDANNWPIARTSERLRLALIRALMVEPGTASPKP